MFFSRFAKCIVIISALIASKGLVAQGESDTHNAVLVSSAWLAAHLDDKDLVLLHAGSQALYDAGHIRRAQHAKVWRVRSTEVDGFNEMAANDLTLELLPDSDLPAVLAHYGITNNSRVVVYFGKGKAELTSAARLILVLAHAGLGDRTSLLQGGLPAWIAEGRTTTTEVPVANPASPLALRIHAITVDAAFVQRHSGKPGFALVDTREADVYNGVPGANKSAPDQALGHIPGAMNVPNELVIDSSAALLSAAELRAVFERAGIQPGDTIVTYCYTGQRATVVMLAAQILGYRAVLYDGSAEDWAARHLVFTVKK